MTDLISRIISEMVPTGPKTQHTCSSLAGAGCSVCGHCAVRRAHLAGSAFWLDAAKEVRGVCFLVVFLAAFRSQRLFTIK